MIILNHCHIMIAQHSWQENKISLTLDTCFDSTSEMPIIIISDEDDEEEEDEFFFQTRGNHKKLTPNQSTPLPPSKQNNRRIRPQMQT